MKTAAAPKTLRKYDTVESLCGVERGVTKLVTPSKMTVLHYFPLIYPKIAYMSMCVCACAHLPKMPSSYRGQ